MRVFDLFDRAAATGKPARIAVLGSCRVNDPFEALVEHGRAYRVWSNAGATPHTLGEAKQNIDYTRGDLDIPAAFEPFVFGTGPLQPRLPALRRMLDTVDTVFVEVCNLHQVWHPPFYFQMDHFWTNFVSRYGAPLQRWYRSFQLGEAPDEAEIVGALQQMIALDGPERAAAEAVLRHTRLKRLQPATAVAQIAETMYDPAKNWVFVSHFVVPGASGAQMADRAELVGLLADAARTNGVTMFDPTVLIARHGREAALAKEGRDLYHYNPPLLPRIAEALLDAAGLEPRRPRCAPRAAAAEAAAAEAVAKSTAPAAVAARVNEVLLRVHRERVERLGVDGSGLYSHYKRMLDDGAIAGQMVVDLAELIVELLPPFDSYHVLRAGLGELMFVLAGAGLPTEAHDWDLSRLDALAAGWRALCDADRAANGSPNTLAIVPDVPPRNRTLAIAHHLLLGPDADEQRVFDMLLRYKGLLLEPRSFLHLRESVAEQEAVVERLRHSGFTTIRDFPQAGLVFCERCRDFEEPRRPREAGIVKAALERLGRLRTAAAFRS